MTIKIFEEIVHEKVKAKCWLVGSFRYYALIGNTKLLYDSDIGEAKISNEVEIDGLELSHAIDILTLIYNHEF